MTDRIHVSRALMSVSNKSGLLDFADGLQRHGVEIISTGGTYQTLTDHGISAIEVASVTEFPEIMNGRVKTLHPKIHGAILGRRELDEGVMATHGIQAIDLVCVNLYPVEEIIMQRDATYDDVIENIDIGGPALVRSAAKNHLFVGIVTSPLQYHEILAEIASGGLTYETRAKLARIAFQHTADYDRAIADYLSQDSVLTKFPEKVFTHFERQSILRYGENPHQSAAFYTNRLIKETCIAQSEKLTGKELSFNNIMDTDAALECVRQFDAPACVIVKHANPCGVAIGISIYAAYERAFETDPMSAFGGIIAFNRKLDLATMNRIIERQFVEVIIAPGVEHRVIGLLKKKPDVRLLTVGALNQKPNQMDFRSVQGGLLIQDTDTLSQSINKFPCVTIAKPNDRQLTDLTFAWKVAKFVKSNAVVYAKNKQTTGIGAGQMSRIHSARIASIKAKDAGLDLRGSVMASDAFLPFRDGIDEAAEAGIEAVIQPGGSIRDAEVIAAADQHGITMLFSDMRHFRH